MKLMFLGDTCGNNNWRESFIENLVYHGVTRECLFNPVVKDWTRDAQEEEERAKKVATHHLYFLADPMLGTNSLSMYSAVEATMALYDHPDSTIVVFDRTNLTGHALKASMQTERVLRERFPNSMIFGDINHSLDRIVEALK